MKVFDRFSNILRWIAGLVLAAAISGCSSGKVTPVELVRHVDDPANGLIRKRNLGDLSFEVQYRPIDYMAVQRNQEPNLSKEQLDQISESFSGMHHFLMRLDVLAKETNVLEYGISSEEDYQRRLHYFSFGMKDDLILVHGNDTIRCALFHFERAFDLSSHRNFVLAFPRNETISNEPLTLIFDSREFNTGPLKFRFRAEALDNIPQIALAP